MDKWICVAACLACMVGTAHSQVIEYRPSKGTKEFGLAGNWTSVSGSSFSSSSGDFGYYITPNLVAAVSVSFDRSNGESQGVWFVGGRYEFISSGQVVPYLRGGFYRRTGHDAVTADKFGTGFNFYFRKNMAFFAEIGFYRFGNHTRDTTTSIDAGFRIFFR